MMESVMKKRNQIIPEVHIIIKKNDKYLLARRCNTGYQDGKYHFPAGHIENDESPKQAATREAQEETDLVVHEKDLKFVHVMYRNIDNEGDRVAFFFETNIYDGEARINEPEKCDDIGWFTKDKMPDKIMPYVKRAFDYISRGIKYSEVKNIDY